MPLRPYVRELDHLYAEYNRPEYVHPDPLEFVLRCQDPADREIVAIVAAVLAYGRVGQILRSVSGALERLGEHPRKAVHDQTAGELSRRFASFKHRFTTGAELAALRGAVGKTVRRDRSLEACFAASLGRTDETVIPALGRFVARLSAEAGRNFHHLLPDPARASACKRLNLFLRWMVRRDAVDPGPWRSVPAAMLVVPLDVHMHRLARQLGACRRKAANLCSALEITRAFRAVCPQDPVKYDFSRHCSKATGKPTYPGSGFGPESAQNPKCDCSSARGRSSLARGRMATGFAAGETRNRPCTLATVSFSLTRLGIHPTGDMAGFLRRCRCPRM